MADSSGKAGFPPVGDFLVMGRNRGMAVSILIADDFPALRRGVRAWLDDRPGFRVIGEAGDGPETLRLVKRLQPDVLVIDVHLPGMNGMDVLALTRKLSTRTRGV